MDLDNFYVCPDHVRTGGYESCCSCGGWEDGDSDKGRRCTEAEQLEKDRLSRENSGLFIWPDKKSRQSKKGSGG